MRFKISTITKPCKIEEKIKSTNQLHDKHDTLNKKIVIYLAKFCDLVKC